MLCFDNWQLASMTVMVIGPSQANESSPPGVVDRSGTSMVSVWL
jgi:hypothetical protein